MSPAEKDARDARERGIMGRLSMCHDEPGPNKKLTLTELTGAVACAIEDRAPSPVIAERWAQVAIHAAERLAVYGGDLEVIQAERDRRCLLSASAAAYPDFRVLMLVEAIGKIESVYGTGAIENLRAYWAQVAAVAVGGYVDAHASPMPPAYVLVDSLAHNFDANEVAKLVGVSIDEARRICARVTS